MINAVLFDLDASILSLRWLELVNDNRRMEVDKIFK
jgi:hypothetical protein